MKKVLLLLMTIFVSFAAFANEVTYTASNDLSGDEPKTWSPANSLFTFTLNKNNGTSAPTYNSNGKDLRIYAKGSIKIESKNGEKITKVVFNLSEQGKKRLAPITANDGTIATQTKGDASVTWTGENTAITFTVGDKANYGSDGETKAGQFCFSSVTITYEENTADTRQDATLTWSAATAETTLGATDFTAPTLTVTPEAAASEVIYSSSNESVAKYENGELSILAAGKTTITAAIANSENYKDASASYTLKVVDPNAPAAEKFMLVTDASTLVNGQKIIIVSNNMALSTTQNKNNRGATTITIADGGIVPSDDVQIITLETTTNKDGENCFAFNVGGKYLYAASSSSNYLKTQDNIDLNATADISITTSGNATITFQGSNTCNILRYNNSSTLFSCYASDKASGQKDVQIYALPAQSTEPVEPVDPEAPAAPVITESWNKVTITAEEGTTIYYTTHESWDETEHAEPTTESTVYSEPIEFYSPISYKAIAVKDGKTSAVASYDVNTYVFDDLGALSDITSDWSAYKFVFNCPLTVVYQDTAKKNLYVSNGFNNMLIYGGDQAAYAPGDVINGVCATYKDYNNLIEFVPTAFGEVNAAAGTVRQPAEIDYSKVAENYMHQYVMLPDVTISSINDKKIAATDAEGHEITVYNQFGITAPTVGTKYDVTGFVGVFGTTYQIYPTEFTSYTGKISLGEAYSYNEYSKANVLTFTATISKNGNPIDDEEKANYEVLLDGVSVGHAGETFSHFAYNKDGKFSLKNGDRTIALDVEWPNLDAVLPTITEAKYITYSDDARVDAKYFIEASDNSYNWTVKSTDENAIVGWDNNRAFCLYENATPDAINVKITFPFAVTKAIAPLAADEEFDIVTYEPANATELSTAEFAKNESNTEVSGVADVAVDQNSAVEYYNLQGVRVNGDLTPGLYIRRQGNQATKVVVR